METTVIEVSLKGRIAKVPARVIRNRMVICEGRWTRLARIHDEDWCEGQAVENPEEFLSSLRKAGIGADLFTFGQALPDTDRKYPYHLEWDNLAIASTLNFTAWWESLPRNREKT